MAGAFRLHGFAPRALGYIEHVARREIRIAAGQEARAAGLPHHDGIDDDIGCRQSAHRLVLGNQIIERTAVGEHQDGPPPQAAGSVLLEFGGRIEQGRVNGRPGGHLGIEYGHLNLPRRLRKAIREGVKDLRALAEYHHAGAILGLQLPERLPGGLAHLHEVALHAARHVQ